MQSTAFGRSAIAQTLRMSVCVVGQRCAFHELQSTRSYHVGLSRHLFSCRGVAAPEPDLKGVLHDFRGNAGLSLQWVLFGSSGHEKRPTPGGPLAHYHKCTGKLSFQMKCMANMYHASHHVLVGNTVHDCTYKCALLSLPAECA